MMRIPVIAITLAAVVASPVGAAEGDEPTRTVYEVEVVIFDQLGEAGAATQERWDPVVIAPRFDGIADFVAAGASASARPEGFEALSNDEARLARAVKRLEASDGYRVLRHLRWRQPPTPPREAEPQRVTAGEPMQLSVPERALRRPDAEAIVADGVASVADEASDAEQEGSQTSSILGDDAGEAVDADHSESAGSTSTPFGSGMLAPKRREITVRPLDGTVTLVVSRYLHLHADLHYTEAVDWREEVRSTRSAPRGIGGDADREDSARPERERVAMARDREGRAVLSYPFEQRRRMRSGELHYLDHPALGILVLVEPRELPAEETSQGGS